MGAALHFHALVEHDDLIAIPNCAQPVRNDQASHPPAPQCVVDQFLGGGLPITHISRG